MPAPGAAVTAPKGELVRGHPTATQSGGRSQSSTGDEKPPKRSARAGTGHVAGFVAGLRARGMRVLVTGAGDYLGRRLLEALRRHLPPGSPGVLLAIAAGTAAYGLALLAVGGVYRRDVAAIPRFGPRLIAVLDRTRLLR